VQLFTLMVYHQCRDLSELFLPLQEFHHDHVHHFA
jgi:hypothetical protein